MMLAIPAVSRPPQPPACAEVLATCARHAEELEARNEALVAEVAVRAASEAALVEAGRQKDAFVATLTHELRSRLMPLSNAAELLARAGDGPGNAAIRKRALGDVARQVRLLERLLEDALDLSRVTHGELTLRRDDAVRLHDVRGEPAVVLGRG